MKFSEWNFADKILPLFFEMLEIVSSILGDYIHAPFLCKMQMSVRVYQDPVSKRWVLDSRDGEDSKLNLRKKGKVLNSS